MRRLPSLLFLAVALTCLAQLSGEAAAPPAPVDPTRRDVHAELFQGGLPRNLADLQAIEARVQQVMQKVIPATVGVGNGGSGVVVNREGLIMTVAHVGQKAGKDVIITFFDGKRVKGKTLGNYKNADAGMAQIVDKGEYPFAEVGKSGTLKQGQWCVAMGYPVSFARGQKPPVRIGRVLGVTATTVTTDCPLMGGDSGGPLFDLDGRVIGVNSRVSSGVNRNVHVAADVYHTHWKKLLGGKDWGEQPRFGKKKGPSSLRRAETVFDLPVAAAPPPQPPAKPAPKSPDRSFGRISDSKYDRNFDGVKAAFREAVAPVASSTVRVLANDQPAALGTIVAEDGLIVTKASQLKGNITCVLADGRKLAAQRLGEDKEFDLAVLRVEAKGLRPVRWRKDGPPVQGSLVAAVGEKGVALGIGTVTSEPRQFRVADRGPRVVAGGTLPTERGYLGVSIDDAKNGVKLISILRGGAAEKAGLKVDDVIKKAGETVLRNSEQLIELVAKHKPGDKLVLLVQRGEKEETVTTVLGRPAPVRASYDRWGGGPFSERRFGFGTVLPHDTVVLPGDCGGPLVDTSGRVVGVNIARSLRISTYALLPADVERVVSKIVAATKKTASR